MKIYVCHYKPLLKRNIYIKEMMGKMNLKFEFITDFDREEIKFNKVFGSDGSNSIIRDQIIHNTCASFIHKPLGHGYKELTMPTSLSGDFLLNSKSLHIWPRGDFMMIALPNPDKTFTLTLFIPLNGSTSF